MSIFINGKVVTLDDKIKIASAFKVKDGCFYDISDDESILELKEDSEEIIDLGGKTVLPGFNDAHLHFLSYAVTKNSVDLTKVTSIDNLIITVKEFIKERKIPDGEWIVSRGWNENFWDKPTLPSRYDLDKISEKHPIYFSRACGHIGVTNSLALKLLNIDRNTPDPEGGIIDRKDGEPTGILRENALNAALEYLQPMSKDKIKTLLNSAFIDALSVGITSMSTEDIWQSGSIENTIEAYEELNKEGLLPIRIVQQMYLPDNKSFETCKEMNLKTGYGDDFFKIGPMKLFQDGSLGGRTAAMEDEYNDTKTNGVSIHSEESLKELINKGHDNGFQICAHAIGDRAMRQLLDVYEDIYETSERDLRFSIIHCQFTNENLLKRFKNNNILANVQPSFVMTDYPIVEKAVGKERSATSYAWRSMLSDSIHTIFSSDAPIESFNPFEGIYAAVTRKDLKGNPSEGWNTHECITVEEALKCYTLEPAYSNFEENKKGTISKGKFADFIVISDDILEIPADDIKDVTVLETYVNGEKKF
ncbi:amidohydrolase [Oceanirhabdus sp. W0125-5]|uniref:amidohydrolase n=1 Tax=Oceanirhabdus sp. W0125-5 TaxID=2999116 RepID=UPI0022F2E7E3|nr:amidohydrolase [Oceanirhabdus sp. W0125-5]WBW98714.1 amidohydrolase [Oceanirhabdus sp. W0125-5]